ncbi:Retrotransposable element Tf2 protein [Rhizoctonia solani]|uniref:Retrotransposable element Tf2 protein n=1 Tax=Rhizoctonia solani TaxID=456999 RepID=A0A8H8P393_9AGAM|nr:Retrotransposable element Tf2 protein [Rhizoctonia solani]QRW23527.1 Retrotransposable element Tf2 protein [Rhizoctonia solani]
MNNIFHDLLHISVIVYLDDILIFSNSIEEHMEHVKEVLSCLLKHNLFCNPAKCYFFVTEVTYIGLVITPDGISMEKEKLQAIMDWPEPQNVKHVQSFLGFAHFYCCFVPNFSCLAHPLNNLTQKKQLWIWLEEQKAAFDAIKAEICKEPVLAHPDESKPYNLETDASEAAMCAVLSQRKEDDCLHPVAFMSASFSPAELNFDTHDKIYLPSFVHLSTGESSWKELSSQSLHHACWYLMLVSYNSVIAYQPGKQSQKPDALSRQPDHMDLEPTPQVVPDEPEIKQQLLSHFHDSPASGHQGQAQTLELISCHYYWPATKFQVNHYVESCEICQRSKGHAHSYALNPLSVPAGPWEDISYDFIVKFPKCKGYDSILETATAEDAAQMFLEHVWKLHGTPKCTVSDRGTTFNSKFLKALYKSLQITPSFSTAYHPQSDGQTEIKNQWLEAYLCPFIDHRQSDWVDWLQLAEFAHNNARSKATGKLPFKSVYGYSPVISPLLEPTGLPIADDKAKQLAETIQEVQASIKWAQERYKQADTGKPPPEFQPGDKVWLLPSNITLQRPNKKLDQK